MTYPEKGSHYGDVIVNQVDINIPLYYGDSSDILALGAGMYGNSKFPGEKGQPLSVDTIDRFLGKFLI